MLLVTFLLIQKRLCKSEIVFSSCICVHYFNAIKYINWIQLLIFYTLIIALMCIF